MHNNTNKPVAEIRLASVKAAIWKNIVDQGNSSRPIYNITFQRIYRDGEGKWQSTDNFGRDDLLTLAVVAQRTFERICELQRSGQTATEPAIRPVT